MALNKNRINARNRADEMIEQMSGSNLASEYANGLAALSEPKEKKEYVVNMFNEPKVSNETENIDAQQVYGPPVPNGFVKPEVMETVNPSVAPAPTKEVISKAIDEMAVDNADLKKTLETAVPVKIETKDIPVKKEVAKTPKASGRRGARTKAERGEECRVQFSTTLTPDMLDKIKSEAKKNYMPLSLFIEKVFMEYFSVH